MNTCYLISSQNILNNCSLFSIKPFFSQGHIIVSSWRHEKWVVYAVTQRLLQRVQSHFKCSSVKIMFWWMENKIEVHCLFVLKYMHVHWWNILAQTCHSQHQQQNTVKTKCSDSVRHIILIFFFYVTWIPSLKMTENTL